jgi:membrane fusion protein, multidrug efflux system
MYRLFKIIIIGAAFLMPFSYLANAGDDNRFTARGLIIALHNPVISSEITAKIKKISFREGEFFQKGSILLSFDDGLLKAQQNRTKAELEAAQLRLQNSQELEKLKSIGTLEVRLAEVDVKMRLAEKAITDISLERCTIIAPFNGRVVELFVNAHESVGVQQKLMGIVSTDQLEIDVMARYEWLAWLKPGLKFTVELDSIDFKTGATVIALGAVVDPVSRMVQIRGRLNNNTQKLLPGMSANVYFAPQE